MNSIHSYTPKMARSLPAGQARSQQALSQQALQFGAFGDDKSFGNSLKAKLGEWGPGKLFKAGVIGLGALTATITGLSNFGYEENPGSTRSVVYSRYSSNGFRTDGDGSISVKKSGYVGLLFEENIPFDTRPQQVRDTFQPFSREGVLIDGDGSAADQGIDIQLTWGIDGGPDKIDMPDGTEKDVKEEERDPYYKKSLPLLAQKIVGTYQFNEKSPVFKRDAAYFATPEINPKLGEMMKMVYYSKVVPVIQESLNIAATKFNASDIHEKRQELEDMIMNGYSTVMKDADGKEIKVQLIKPLPEKLLENGVRLKKFELTKFDSPAELSELNQQRTNISIDNNTLKLQKEKFDAQKDQKRSTVQAKFATLIEKQRGDNQAAIARAIGQASNAKETALTKEQEGIGYKNTELAKAEGEAKKAVLEAQKKAAEIRRDANIYKAGKESEAARIFSSLTASAKVEAEAKMKLGEMLRQHPEYLEQLRIAAASKNQESIAKLIEGMLLSPGTSPVDVLKKVTPNTVEIRLAPAPVPAAPQPEGK